MQWSFCTVLQILNLPIIIFKTLKNKIKSGDLLRLKITIKITANSSLLITCMQEKASNWIFPKDWMHTKSNNTKNGEQPFLGIEKLYFWIIFHLFKQKSLYCAAAFTEFTDSYIYTHTCICMFLIPLIAHFAQVTCPALDSGSSEYLSFKVGTTFNMQLSITYTSFTTSVSVREDLGG